MKSPPQVVMSANVVAFSVTITRFCVRDWNQYTVGNVVGTRHGPSDGVMLRGPAEAAV